VGGLCVGGLAAQRRFRGEVQTVGISKGEDRNQLVVGGTLQLPSYL
jgi:hypothetical protein